MSDFFQYDETLERTQTRDPHDLSGYHVHATDGSLGRVMEFSDTPGASFLVVDTGRTLFSKRVVVPAGSVERVDRDGKEIHVNLSKEQIKDAPEFDEHRYAHGDYHRELERHYGGA